jgi:hypothetical protein
MTKAETEALTKGLDRLVEGLLDLTKTLSRGVNNLEMVVTMMIAGEVFQNIPDDFLNTFDWDRRFKQFAELSLKMREEMRDARLEDRRKRGPRDY